jgi:hypothetical protein
MPFRGFALAVASLLLAGPALAQLSMDRRLADSLRVAANPNDTTGWRFSALNSLNATQVSFVNWAAGGENSFALAAIGNYQAHYHRRRNAWDNILDVAYGIQKQGENPFRKNEDRLDVLSKYAYLLRDNFGLSLRANFRSQFDNGYKLPDDSTVVSRFMAPAYLTLSLGVEYKPRPWISIIASPATGRITFVNDQRLANAGAYGVQAATLDSAGAVLVPGKRHRMEFGALASILLNKSWEKVKVQSRLDFFNNFTDPIRNHRANVDVNWETLVSVAVTKWLGITVTTNLVYDHDIAVPLYETRDGVRTQIGTGPRLQFKGILGVGLRYQISSR